MLWVTDLSLQDPFYVLPILMGATMFIQQKITPTTMDPTQAKIMLVLPIGLTFLFVNFPAGLVLYWVTNNVLTISQQLITDRFLLNDKALASAGAEQSSSPNA
jgi:YidC/Oxa1 family membrane protein insertase